MTEKEMFIAGFNDAKKNGKNHSPNFSEIIAMAMSQIKLN